MQTRFLLFIKNLVVCCHHNPKLFGNLNSVRPIDRISFAWRFRNFRASADFAIRVLGICVIKLCFLPALFEVGFAEDARKEEVLVLVLTRQLEIRLSNLKIPLSISFREWLKPLFRSSKALVWCSVACTPGTTKGMWLSVFNSMFSHS